METRSYMLLAAAEKFFIHYNGLYAHPIETPWIADLDTIRITCGLEDNIIKTDDGRGLVGSAEQGFLQMIIDKKLPPTSMNLFSIGPCFRNEKEDRTHKKQFMKAELFAQLDTQYDAEDKAQLFLDSAFDFFACTLREEKPWGTDPEVYDLKIIDTDVGWDIELNGIEIGSYGCRYHERVGWWAYGTALAEPRFTTAMVLAQVN